MSFPVQTENPEQADQASCCTCASLLSDKARYSPSSEKPLPDHRRLDCCARIICGDCIHACYSPFSYFLAFLLHLLSISSASCLSTSHTLSTHLAHLAHLVHLVRPVTDLHVRKLIPKAIVTRRVAGGGLRGQGRKGRELVANTSSLKQNNPRFLAYCPYCQTPTSPSYSASFTLYSSSRQTPPTSSSRTSLGPCSASSPSPSKPVFFPRPPPYSPLSLSSPPPPLLTDPEQHERQVKPQDSYPPPYSSLSASPPRSPLPTSSSNTPPSPLLDLYQATTTSPLPTHPSLPPPPSQSSQQPTSAPSDPEKAREDTLHFVRPTDTVASLSLRYAVPAHVLRLANRLPADHLLPARRTLIIPASHYAAGVSHSPRPVEGEAEEARKAKIRRWMVTCKEADYAVAELYLDEAGYDLEEAIARYVADTSWERANPNPKYRHQHAGRGGSMNSNRGTTGRGSQVHGGSKDRGDSGKGNGGSGWWFWS